MTATPGWYPDPAGPRGQLRYYDGTQWTEHRAAAPVYPQPQFQAVAPRRLTADGRELATWGIRFGAWIIDLVIVGIVSSIALIQVNIDFQHLLQANENNFQNQVNAGGRPGLDVLFSGLGHDFLLLGVGQLAIQLLYGAVFLLWLGATPGKLMVGLRVEPAAGPGRLSFASVIERVLVQYVPGPLTAGVFTLVDGLWPLGDEKRQALHEKWARTQVIRRR